MSIEKYDALLLVHTKIFRGFIRSYGRSMLRRVLLALEHNQSVNAIKQQLHLPKEDIEAISQVFKTAA